jgi:hypothetical protein
MKVHITHREILPVRTTDDDGEIDYPEIPECSGIAQRTGRDAMFRLRRKTEGYEKAFYGINLTPGLFQYKKKSCNSAKKKI